MSNGYRKLKVFPKSYIRLPCLSFLDKSFNWLSYQHVELHDIKDMEAQMNFGSVDMDREDIQNSQT